MRGKVKKENLGCSTLMSEKGFFKTQNELIVEWLEAVFRDGYGMGRFLEGWRIYLARAPLYVPTPVPERLTPWSENLQDGVDSGDTPPGEFNPPPHRRWATACWIIASKSCVKSRKANLETLLLNVAYPSP